MVCSTQAVPDMQGDIYSNPVEQKKVTTPDRRKKSSLPLSPPVIASSQHIEGGSIDLDKQLGLGDYASVEDALKHTEMSAGMVHSLRRQARRSPSMSPPPPPMSPPTRTIMEEVEEGVEPGDMYATVDTSHKKPQTPTGGVKGYDHLVPDDSPPMKGYDHLNPPPPMRPPRTDLAPKSQATPSTGKYAPLVGVASTQEALPSDVYDTLEEGPMYATIEVCKKKKPEIPDRTPSPAPIPLPRTKPPPPVPTPSPGGMDDYMYSTVSKPRPASQHLRMKSADLTSIGYVPQPSQPPQPDLDQMYSVVQKPRPQPKPRRALTPEEPVYSIPERKPRAPPPQTAPKPASRSPTPGSGEGQGEGPSPRLKPAKRKPERFTHIRSESLDTGLLSSASYSDPRSRTHSLNQRQRENTALADQRSPSPEVSSN